MRYTIAIIITIALLFGGCAAKTAQDPSITENEKSLTATVKTEITVDCEGYEETDEPVRLHCSAEEKKWYIIADLSNLQMIDVSAGRNIFDASKLSTDKKLLMVGDFKPGWSQGIEGTRHGDEVWFDITLFIGHDGTHRTAVKVEGEAVWLFLEPLPPLRLVTITKDTESKSEGICLGFVVNGKNIIEFDATQTTFTKSFQEKKKTAKAYILPKIGFAGKNLFTRDSEDTKLTKAEE